MSKTTNMTHGSTGYLIVLPNIIIEIPLTSNPSWLPLFYALSPELANKRPQYAGAAAQHQHAVDLAGMCEIN